MLIILIVINFSIFTSLRENVEALIKDVNCQKNAIKKNGIVVDGRHFKVKFTGNYFCYKLSPCSS